MFIFLFKSCSHMTLKGVFIIIIIIDDNDDTTTTQKTMLQDAQHLRHLNTLIDTIRWLVTSTGWYINTGLEATEKYHEHNTWKGPKCRYHYYVGRTGFHSSNDTRKLTWYSTADKEKIWLLIDIAVPDDSHINTKESEKLSKYNTKTRRTRSAEYGKWAQKLCQL